MEYYDIVVTTTNESPGKFLEWVQKIWKEDGRKIEGRIMDGRDVWIDFERCYIYGATENLRKRIAGMATAMNFPYRERKTPADSMCLS